MRKYEVIEHEIKESVTEKVLKRYYTIAYQRKKYYFFGPLVWQNYFYTNVREYTVCSIEMKFNTYKTALAKCNELNSEWVETFLIVYNSKYSLFKETLINKFTGEHHKERYQIYKKFIIDIPWDNFNNYDDAMIQFKRLSKNLPKTYVSSTVVKN